MSSTRKIVSFLALAAVLLSVAGAWLVFGKKRSISPAELQHRLGDHEAARWLDLKNSALAAIENGQHEQADVTLRELASSAVGEPVACRNWVINRLLTVAAIDEEKDSDAYRDALEKAESACVVELRLEGSGAAPHLLASKVAQFSHNDIPRRVELLAAARESPSDPFAWHEIYLVQRDSTDPAARADSEEALKKLGEIVPNNLYVLLEYLKVESRQHAAAVLPAFERIRRLLLPFFPGDPSQDFGHWIDEGESAAKQGNWAAVDRAVQAITKAGSGLVAVQWDRRRVDRGIGWYIVSDFSDAFYEKYPFDRALSHGPSPGSLIETEPAGLPPDLNDVRDAKLVDVDSDGRLEIAVLRRGAFEIYRRPDAGPNWSLFAAAQLPAESFDHFLAAELDGVALARGDAAAKPSTADPDFVLFGPAGVQILENRLAADGKTRTIRAARPGELGERTKGAQSVALIDFDRDGALDLVVARQEISAAMGAISVWRNRRNLEFEDVSSRSTIVDAPISAASLIPVDWDRDLDVDLMITAGKRKSTLGFLKGEGEGRFHHQPIRTSEPIFQGAAALAVLDADANGSWDLLAAGPSGIALWLTSSIQHGQSKTLRIERISDFPTKGLFVVDLDNDGYQDVIAWGEVEVRVFVGAPEGHLVPADPSNEVTPSHWREMVALDDGDIDSDGDTDLLVLASKDFKTTGFGSLRLVRNDDRKRNNWIDVRLSDKAGFASAGLGSVLQLKTGAVCQSRIVSKPVTRFGIGELERADVLRILWPSGTPSNIERPAKNRIISVEPPPRVLPTLTQLRRKPVEK